MHRRPANRTRRRGSALPPGRWMAGHVDIDDLRMSSFLISASAIAPPKGMFHVKLRGSIFLHLRTGGRPYIPAVMETTDHDVIVVGGGTRAAAAASGRMGARTLLVTHKAATIRKYPVIPPSEG